MKKLSLYIAFLVCFSVFSQEQINWVSTTIDTSMRHEDVKSLSIHTSILPKILHRKGSRSDTIAWKEVKKFNIFPMSDLVAGNTMNHFQVRTGLGLGLNWFPMKGMNFQLGYVGGVANNGLINYMGGVYPKSYFRKQMTSNLVQYHDIRARLSYSPNKHFNFQVGLDNNKIGEGDRSLLLGNYGSPYPFAQIRVKVWRIEYVVMYQFLRESNGVGGYFSKYATSHYLSINAAKGFNIGVFETVIWKGKDSAINRGYEWMYWNPVLFFRPAEYSLGSSDNVLLGLNASYKLNRSVQFYAQWLLDDFLLSAIQKRNKWWATKFGIQFGIKGYAPFGLKSITYLSEFNMVRPFTYSHGSTGQSYSNQGSVLAHPYGANFIEWNTKIKWQKENWDARLNIIYAMRGKDASDTVSWGGNILKSYNLRPKQYGFSIGNGTQHHLFKTQLTVGYQIIPKWKLRCFITGEMSCYTQNGKTNYYSGIFLGIRTALWNDKRNY